MNTQTARKMHRKELMDRYGISEKVARRITKTLRKSYLRTKYEHASR